MATSNHTGAMSVQSSASGSADMTGFLPALPQPGLPDASRRLAAFLLVPARG
ncbi:MAG: hypothetical protein R3303_00285 [Marinobacter sp.]|nr:hypothetical protein [Marinobacter sp.]